MQVTYCFQNFKLAYLQDATLETGFALLRRVMDVQSFVWFTVTCFISLHDHTCSCYRWHSNNPDKGEVIPSTGNHFHIILDKTNFSKLIQNHLCSVTKYNNTRAFIFLDRCL